MFILLSLRGAYMLASDVWRLNRKNACLLLDSGNMKSATAAMSMFGLAFLTASMSPTAIPVVSPEVKAIVAELDKASGPPTLTKLETLAERDDGARMLLGEIHFFGLFGARVDEDKGCNYFEPLSLKYGEGAHNFATCFFKANGTRKDPAMARLYYQKAIDLGWRDSACALGNMMIEGKGGAKDVAAGMELCGSAAAKGIAHAQADYGTYLLLGRVVPKNAIEARKWLELAAQQNHGNASYLLGQIYWNGDGVDKDRSVAAKWLKVAFAHGRPDAAHLLAQEAMARMLIKDREKTTFSSALLPETIYWLEMTQKVKGQSEQKAKDRELLDMLYSVQTKLKKEE